MSINLRFCNWISLQIVMVAKKKMRDHKEGNLVHSILVAVNLRTDKNHLVLDSRHIVQKLSTNKRSQLQNLPLLGQ